MTAATSTHEPVKVGDIDPMSVARREMMLPRCSWPLPNGMQCTRAAGHDEMSDTGKRGGRVSPATAMHVRADRFGVVLVTT